MATRTDAHLRQSLQLVEFGRSHAARLAIAVLPGLLLLIAAFFAARRIAGAFSSSPNLFTLLTVAIALVGIASIPRVLWFINASQYPRGVAWYVFVAATVAACLLAIAVALPQASIAGLLLFAAIVFASEGAWWVAAWKHLVRRPMGVSVVGPPASETANPISRQPISPTLDEPTAAIEQSMTRVIDDSGAEVISGIARCHLVAGQRTQSLHLAFCPALRSVPELFAEQIDGPFAELTVSEVQTFGARIDIRLRSAAEEDTSVLIEFVARTEVEA